MLTPEQIAQVRAAAGAPPLEQAKQVSLSERLGLNAAQDPSAQPPPTSKNTPGALGAASSVVGGDKLAQGVGRAIFNSTTDEAAQQTQGDQTQNALRMRLVKELSDPSISPDVKTHIKDFFAKHGTGGLDQNALNETTTANLTNKEVLGSAAQLGTTFAGMAIPGGSTLAAKVGLKGSKTAALGANAITGAGLGYASDVATNAEQNKENVSKPGLGTFVGGALPFATALVSAMGKQVLAKTTGAGTEVLQHALDNPEAVNTAINTYATTPEAKASLVDKAKGAIGDFLHSRSLEYGSNIKTLQPKEGFNVLPTATESFTKNISKFGGEVKNGQLIFTDSTLTKADQNNLRQAYSTISKWKDGGSVEGADKLRQAVGNLMEDFKISGNTRANSVLGGVKTDLTKAISDSASGYADTLSQYGSKTQTAKELLKELTLSGNAKPSTQLNQVMRIFKKDPAIRDNLVKVMGEKEADQFLNEISGAILTDWFPPGVVGNAARAAIESAGVATIGATSGAIPMVATGAASLAATSPRIVGKTTVLAGKAAKAGVNTALRRTSAIESSRLNP